MDHQAALSSQISRSHQARQMAESFGVDPARYDRARPSYPQAMVERIVETSPGREVVDAGTGTGIAARQFAAAGCRVVGVEPDPRMADFARTRGCEVEVAKFEEWDPAGRTFDLVIAGQAWHWVDPVAGASKAREVLRPGGRLALFWNAMEPPPELEAAFAEAYREAISAVPWAKPAGDAGSPSRATSAVDGYSMMVAKASRGLDEVGGFGPSEEWRFEWESSHTRDEWLDRLPTSGGLTLAPPDQLEPLLARIGAAIDAVGGGFTARWTTVVGTATRTDHP